MTRSCPTPVELLQHVFADAQAPEEHRVRRHVAGCANCQAAIAELRAASHALRIATAATPAATSECLDEETLAALAEGSIGPTSATRELEHLLGCARCRRELASTATLLEDPAIARETARLAGSGHGATGSRRRSLARLGGIAAAAAVILAVTLLLPSHQPPAGTYRELSVTGSPPPVLLAPIGVAAAPDAFHWTSVPRADRYRVTVFDANGSVIWEAQTRDTAIAIPAVIARMDDTVYLWRVEARVGWEDRWTASGLAEVTVHSGRSR